MVGRPAEAPPHEGNASRESDSIPPRDTLQSAATFRWRCRKSGFLKTVVGIVVSCTAATQSSSSS
eukprot:12078381-Alexandrium_andersonii.AAC.1